VFARVVALVTLLALAWSVTWRPSRTRRRATAAGLRRRRRASRAFHNQCQHTAAWSWSRGALGLLTIRCGYHDWGLLRLRRARSGRPAAASRVPRDRSAQLGLLRRPSPWEAWLFVACPDPRSGAGRGARAASPAIAACGRPLAPGRHPSPTSVPHATGKLLVENHVDVYHLVYPLHAESLGHLDTRASSTGRRSPLVSYDRSADGGPGARAGTTPIAHLDERGAERGSAAHLLFRHTLFAQRRAVHELRAVRGARHLHRADPRAGVAGRGRRAARRRPLLRGRGRGACEDPAAMAPRGSRRAARDGSTRPPSPRSSAPARRHGRPTARTDVRPPAPVRRSKETT
jgi:hypothetical protein